MTVPAVPAERTVSGVPTADLLALMLADARLPTGGHTQSGGLEPALRQGMSITAVPEYLRTRLATVTLVEAATAVLARRVTAHSATPAVMLAQLTRIDAAWRARTVAKALRENADLLGRGYARLARRLWPGSPAVGVLDGIDRPVRAVVLGVVAAAAGLDDVRVAELVGYDDVATVAAAALKLAPMDPADTTAWILALSPDIAEMARAAVGVTGPADLPAGSAPELEEWAEQHAAATQRLFRS